MNRKYDQSDKYDKLDEYDEYFSESNCESADKFEAKKLKKTYFLDLIKTERELKAGLGGEGTLGSTR